MTVDLFILQLAIIFLPGIIWAGLDAGFAAKIKPSEPQFLLRVFVFGLTSYAVEFLILTIFGQPFHMADLADASKQQIVGTSILWEVLGALAIGVVLSIGWLYSARFKLLARALQRIGATKNMAMKTSGTSCSTQGTVQWIMLMSATSLTSKSTPDG